MRKIKALKTFNKDYKRVQRAGQKNIDDLLKVVIDRLLVDQPLPEKYRDHLLIGNWRDHRECRLKHDLLLIYQQPIDGNGLILVRMGTHNELF